MPMRHAPAVLAALITSALVFVAGFMYEGNRLRGLTQHRLDELVKEVKALEARVLELERAKK